MCFPHIIHKPRPGQFGLILQLVIGHSGMGHTDSLVKQDGRHLTSLFGIESASLLNFENHNVVIL